MDPSSIGSDEEKFATELEEARSAVARIKLERSRGTDTDATGPLEAFRKQAFAELDRIAEEFRAATSQDLTETIRQIWVSVGRLQGAAERLDQAPFRVTARTRPLNNASRNGERHYIYIIEILSRDNPIPIEVAQLKSRIDGVNNVIDAVFAERLARQPWTWTRLSWEDDVHIRRGEYLKQLAGAADVGLCSYEPSRIAFAFSEVDRIRALFKLQEGGRIKNNYVSVLWFWCALATVTASGLWWISYRHLLEATIGAEPSKLLYDLRNFEVLAAGTAVGTWLSFSLRKQDIAFEDLAAIEPDRLAPAARVNFMIGLAVLVGLLLYTGAIVAGVGSADGGTGMRQKGSIALLIGLLAGVGERALGNAVSSRGAEFAQAIGGAGRPSAGGMKDETT